MDQRPGRPFVCRKCSTLALLDADRFLVVLEELAIATGRIEQAVGWASNDSAHQRVSHVRRCVVRAGIFLLQRRHRGDVTELFGSGNYTEYINSACSVPTISREAIGS